MLAVVTDGKVNCWEWAYVINLNIIKVTDLIAN